MPVEVVVVRGLGWRIGGGAGIWWEFFRSFGGSMGFFEEEEEEKERGRGRRR